MDVIIIDDERLARDNLISALTRFCNWQVVACLDNASEALARLLATPVDIAFVDINMPGINGLEMVEALRGQGIQTQVIFVTAYEQHALKAFELDAVDYLLKPFDDRRFLTCKHKIEQRLQKNSTQEHNQNVILARSVGKIDVIPLDDIMWLKTAANYLELHLKSGQCILHRTTLNEFLQAHPIPFVRTHRSTAVRTHWVRCIIAEDDKDWVVTQDDVKLPLTKDARQTLLAQLSGQAANSRTP